MPSRCSSLLTRENIENQQQNIAANRQKIDRTWQDFEENTKRFMSLSEYDVKAEATVKFNVGSSRIAAKDQGELKKLAETATGLKGYIIEVTGYADSTGHDAINTKLSEDRAKAVITYLDATGWSAGAAYRGTGRDGRIRSSGTERD